jgi:predicted nucleic acid-binding protein
MSLLVDTSVWSLAIRRDRPPETAEVEHLAHTIRTGQPIAATGLILQELLQGAVAPATRAAIADRFDAVTMLVPTTADHVAAAELSNTCRRRGVQLRTVDALIGQLCIAHDLVLLTADANFRHAAKHVPIRVWSA